MEKSKKTFSIVVPVYKEQEIINQCLENLTKLERIDESEVIIIDGDKGSTVRDIHVQHLPFDLSTLESQKGRGPQLNRGAQVALTDILIFLHVDTTLPVNALSLIEDTLKDYSAGSFRLSIDSGRYFLRLGNFLANLRAGVNKIPFGDQVYFMQRDIFFQIGGFQAIPIMEDVALMLELRKRKIRLHILKEKVITSDRRWNKEGMVRATFRNWILYASYRMGVPVEKLARRYIPHPE